MLVQGSMTYVVLVRDLVFAQQVKPNILCDWDFVFAHEVCQRLLARNLV